MAADKEIGPCECPLCHKRDGRAVLGLSKKNLVYVTSGCCKAQIFARGDESDDYLRSLLIAANPEPATVPAPEPQKVAPGGDPAPAPKQPAPAPVSAPPAPAKRAGWGILG